MQHPAVLEARRDRPRPTTTGLIKPKAFVVLEATGTRRRRARRRAARRFVQGPARARTSTRAWIEFVDDLPKTATGKIHALQAARAGVGSSPRERRAAAGR
ncbi:MAG: hypothetical protein MZU95_03230 [Desulfomicrobium escambiense]|nr:hypothetical protein [Desulfomicrobium escambiense]